MFVTESAPALTRRTMLRAIAGGGVLGAALLGCGAQPPTVRPPAAPVPLLPSQSRVPPGTLVMIVRHGEKPDGSNPGIDPNGNPDDSSMTQAGYTRARRLVDVFNPAQGLPRPGLARPSALFAAGANEGGAGTRTRETIAPLAQRLGIPANTTFGKGEEVSLVAQVTSQPGPTLICWQHVEIPTIAAAFGYVTPAPPRVWPDDRYDVIWTLTATATGWTFAQLPELALPTDQNTVISNTVIEGGSSSSLGSPSDTQDQQKSGQKHHR